MRKQNKKVYYAHSLKIYNTKRERKEFRFLKKNFLKICNPNMDIIWDNTTKMQPYFEAVKNSDILVCSEYKNHVGRGVYEEIKIALKNSVPVLCLRRKYSRFKLQQVKNIAIINEKDWTIKYGFVLTN